MSHRLNAPSTHAALAAVVFVAAVTSMAQQPRPAAAPQPVNWALAVPETSFKGPKVRQDSTWAVRTPRIHGTSQAKEQTWGLFEYTFETKAYWTDNMTATFYVLLDAIEIIKKQEVPKDTPRFSFMQLALRYSDIPKGKDHKIAAVLLPVALERFGKPIAIGVEVTVGDTVVYVDDRNVDEPLAGRLRTVLQANPGGKLPKWWEYINSDSTFQSVMTRRNDYLVDRSKTPFSVVAIDDYLMSK